MTGLKRALQALAVAMISGGAGAHPAALPADILRQIPPGYAQMTSAITDLDGDHRADYIVVVRYRNEADAWRKMLSAPPRPLMIFMQRADHHFMRLARNDSVVMRVNEGGQCDPFMDGGDGAEGIAVKGAYFTVQNAVSCGDHWSDYVTFRYVSALHGVIFHKRIFESMIFNPDNNPKAEALIAGPRHVTAENPLKPVLLQHYRRNRH